MPLLHFISKIGDAAGKPGVTLAMLLLESAKNVIEKLGPMPPILSSLDDTVTRAVGAGVGLQLAADAQARYTL